MGMAAYILFAKATLGWGAPRASASTGLAHSCSRRPGCASRSLESMGLSVRHPPQACDFRMRGRTGFEEPISTNAIWQTTA